MAKQISALGALLIAHREGEVVVVSGRDDFGVGAEGGDSFVNLGLVKENFSILFHT